MTILGTVTQINIYPVKSLAGISVESASLWWYGLAGDRKTAFVKSDDPSAFPWLTGRDYPDLIRYQARLSDPNEPATSPIHVQTLSGMDLPLDDPELLRSLTQHAGRPLHLMRLNRGVFDAMPISVLSTTTVQSLAAEIADIGNAAIDIRRFRANIVVDVEQPTHDFPEERWLNKTITFGNAGSDTGKRIEAAQIQTNYRTQRCSMVNIDPDTSEQNPAVLKKVGQLWNACAGIYAATKQIGTIRVGDSVSLTDK